MKTIITIACALCANPHFPALRSVQWLFQKPPAKSKFLAAGHLVRYSRIRLLLLHFRDETANLQGNPISKFARRGR